MSRRNGVIVDILRRLLLFYHSFYDPIIADSDRKPRNQRILELRKLVRKFNRRGCLSAFLLALWIPESLLQANVSQRFSNRDECLHGRQWEPLDLPSARRTLHNHTRLVQALILNPDKASRSSVIYRKTVH